MLKALVKKDIVFGAFVRSIFTSPVVAVKKYVVTKTDNVTVIEGKIEPSPRESLLLKVDYVHEKACPICRLGDIAQQIKHTDVLILCQFIDKRNQMLPRRVTGLCEEQQKRISDMVSMAHRAGLLHPPPYLPGHRKDIGYNKYYDESTIDVKPYVYQPEKWEPKHKLHKFRGIRTPNGLPFGSLS